jgi:WD40 repeat protein
MLFDPERPIGIPAAMWQAMGPSGPGQN